jgi:hypothetical protein
MGFKSKKPDSYNLLMQNIIVGEEIYKNIKKSIDSTASCIPECLQGQDFVKGRIKKIN